MTTQLALDGSTIRTISTDELREILAKPGTVVVDSRPLAAYNGWRLGNEARGGHIPGAVAFPLTWLERLGAADAHDTFADKGILAADRLIVYGDGTADAIALATVLVDAGAPDVRVLEEGFATWAANSTLPVERLPRYEALVHTEWLRALLDGQRPEAAPSHDWLLIHVNFGVPEEYEEAHLPGALYLDTNQLENPLDWNRRSPEEIEQALTALGITRRTTVVLYGRDTEGQADEKWPGRRAGQIAATRAALILRYAGVDDVRILDGG